MTANLTLRPEQVNQPRTVEQLVTGKPTSDGAGVQLTRVLTQALQRRLDPFLMLDAFGSDNPDDYIAGFPDHPHRGFETVTYMIAGRMLHRDSAGHEGLLSNGGAVATGNAQCFHLCLSRRGQRGGKNRTGTAHGDSCQRYADGWRGD